MLDPRNFTYRSSLLAFAILLHIYPKSYHRSSSSSSPVLPSPFPSPLSTTLYFLDILEMLSTMSHSLSASAETDEHHPASNASISTITHPTDTSCSSPQISRSPTSITMTTTDSRSIAPQSGLLHHTTSSSLPHPPVSSAPSCKNTRPNDMIIVMDDMFLQSAYPYTQHLYDRLLAYIATDGHTRSTRDVALVQTVTSTVGDMTMRYTTSVEEIAMRTGDDVDEKMICTLRDLIRRHETLDGYTVAVIPARKKLVDMVHKVKLSGAEVELWYSLEGFTGMDAQAFGQIRCELDGVMERLLPRSEMSFDGADIWQGRMTGRRRAMREYERRGSGKDDIVKKRDEVEYDHVYDG